MYVSFLVIKGQQKGDHFHMWSMSFAVGHRVDTIKFSDPSTLMAQNIPPDSFVPQQEEYSIAREHMRQLIHGIITLNIY